MELINRGADVNAKEHASDNLEEPDYYNSAISILLSISLNFQSRHFEPLFIMLSQTCKYFEPGLLGKFNVTDKLVYAKLYIEKTVAISSHDMIGIPSCLRETYVNILKWLRIRQILVSNMDNCSIFSIIPIDVINYIIRLFYKQSNLNLPEHVISPFWDHFYSNYKIEFEFLK